MEREIIIFLSVFLGCALESAGDTCKYDARGNNRYPSGIAEISCKWPKQCCFGRPDCCFVWYFWMMIGGIISFVLATILICIRCFCRPKMGTVIMPHPVTHVMYGYPPHHPQRFQGYPGQQPMGYGHTGMFPGAPMPPPYSEESNPNVPSADEAPPPYANHPLPPSDQQSSSTKNPNSHQPDQTHPISDQPPSYSLESPDSEETGPTMQNSSSLPPINSNQGLINSQHPQFSSSISHTGTDGKSH